MSTSWLSGLRSAGRCPACCRSWQARWQPLFQSPVLPHLLQTIPLGSVANPTNADTPASVGSDTSQVYAVLQCDKYYAPVRAIDIIWGATYYRAFGSSLLLLCDSVMVCESPVRTLLSGPTLLGRDHYYDLDQSRPRVRRTL